MHCLFHPAGPRKFAVPAIQMNEVYADENGIVYAGTVGLVLYHRNEYLTPADHPHDYGLSQFSLEFGAEHSHPVWPGKRSGSPLGGNDY